MLEIIILTALVSVVLYALYCVYGPFSYNAESAWDKGVQLVAFVLWIGLSVALAMMLIPAQQTLFATIVLTAGAVVVLIVVLMVACLIFWALFSWIEISVIPAIERFFSKRK